jgi:hypothetical protein
MPEKNPTLRKTASLEKTQRVFKNLCQVKARARNSTENTAKETNALRLLSAKNESRTCLAAEPQSILSRADNTKKNNKVLMPW